jgi:DNA-binding transcriptional regulator YhcF (GntR family)
VGLESEKLGHGGDRHLAMITGVSVDTIAKGRRELKQAKASERIRAPGGGRLRAEKKTRRF